MKKKTFLIPVFPMLLTCFGGHLFAADEPSAANSSALSSSNGSKPNIIFILADDLGYNEVGVYGQDMIKTPFLDQLAAEGMRFAQFYAGAPVCATSRSVLMTGQHSGRTRVRGNAWPEDNGRQELYPEDITIAEVLKRAGYATAMIGKWGLGMPKTGGHPNKQGFDYFYGYLSQHHAHNFYPAYLWRNEEMVGLPNVVMPRGKGWIYGAGVASEPRVYAPDLFVEEALSFIDQNKDRPFFLYYPTNVPHSNNEATSIRRADGAEVPELGEYADKDWMLGAKRHAAMITLMDRDIGAMMKRLDDHGIADNTIFIFTSDNGPHRDHAEPMDFFEPAKPLYEWKMSLWEGGLRVPCIVRWPAVIKPGQVSDKVGYFGDFMSTFVEVAGQRSPRNLDSASLLPIWRGEPDKYEAPEFLYWEFHGRDVGMVALLDGRWKGTVRDDRPDHLELYDLKNDIGEREDVSEKYPKIAQRIRDFIPTARTESETWPPAVEVAW